MALINLKKCLVYKVPLDIVITQKTNNDQYITREISLDDIQNDEWLNQDKKSLLKLIKSGHIGVITFDKAKQTVAARGFIALNGKNPNHIPKIPKGAAWLHYGAVKKEYRGQGLFKDVMSFSIQLIRKTNDTIEIYSDTEEDNIPSRITHEKNGLIEQGVYKVLKIGTQRISHGCIQLGFWNKSRKHPEMLK